METALIAQWAALNKTKKYLEAELDFTKEKMSQLEAAVIDEMTESGVTQCKIDQYGVIYLHTDYYPKQLTDDRQERMSAIKETFPDLVQEDVHPARFRAVIRELAKAGEPLPASLAGVYEIAEKHSLRNRKN